MTGSLAVLSVGMGDIEVRFNQHDEAETAKALKMLDDMKARGYAILVRLDDGSYVRAVDIDRTRGCYVVQIPADGAVPADVETEAPRKGKRGRRARGPSI